VPDDLMSTCRADRRAEHVTEPGLDRDVDEGQEQKAMIVCVSRKVCVKVYDALSELRPGWAHEAVDKGKMKIVFTVTPAI
jgi:type I site-specific restriction-modification system R (restriction) subunit